MSTYHYHVDHLGTPRQVTNASSVIVGRHDYLPFGPEVTGTRTDEPKLQDLKFAGHERDEARDRPPLDYMHARYYEPRLGRFLSVDPGRDWEVSQPQSWNAYAYVRNNPINATDPDGRALETIWDVANIGLGLASLADNFHDGDYTGATLDAAGVILDSAAAVVPFMPGGAGTAIKLARTADAAGDLVATGRVAHSVGSTTSTSSASTSGNTKATQIGRQAHREFADKVKKKPGWQSEPQIKGPNGETLKPDAISPSGRPVELKPKTPSGRRRGQKQIKKYEEATGKKGRVVYYDPNKIKP